MRKVAKKVSKLSLFSQLSAPIKSGVMRYLDKANVFLKCLRLVILPFFPYYAVCT